MPKCFSSLTLGSLRVSRDPDMPHYPLLEHVYQAQEPPNPPRSIRASEEIGRGWLQPRKHPNIKRWVWACGAWGLRLQTAEEAERPFHQWNLKATLRQSC